LARAEKLRFENAGRQGRPEQVLDRSELGMDFVLGGANPAVRDQKP
jgi:hypothetical protein